MISQAELAQEMSRFRLVLLGLLWFSLRGSLPAQSPPPATVEPCVTQPAIRIPMRDGKKLCASLYLPKSDGKPIRLPVIATLTPYHRQTWESWATYFASHGYVFASVDVRGRGDSEGEFEPYLHEGRDGFDTVEWLARQSFCDGHIGLWGGSYAGYNQWAIAAELPPHLSTIAPAAAAHPGVDVPFYNNIGQPYLVQWLTTFSGGPQEQLADNQPFWKEKFLAAYRQHIPFKSLDTFVGSGLTSFHRFLEHPLRDTYYDRLTPAAQSYYKMSIPILTITGQYDEEAFGALTYYRDHLAHAVPQAATKHHLLIGPWNHAGTRVPTDEAGGVKFGPAALLDLKDLHRQWYDWTMKGGPHPVFLKKRVTYYLLGPGNEGKGEWQYADNLALFAKRAQTFYLDSDAENASDVAHPGRLTKTVPQKGSDHFTYDPMDTKRGETIDGLDTDKGELIDPRYAASIKGDGLVYETEPFPAETELAGSPALRLWLALDTPDADLEAYLYEMQPDGMSIQLWAHTCRLCYCDSLRKAKLVNKNETFACDLAPGLFIARRLIKGSKLRLIVSSPNTIWAEKNYNSGGVVAEETAKDARVAHIVVYHDLKHRSVLLVPLISQAKE